MLNIKASLRRLVFLVGALSIVFGLTYGLTTYTYLDEFARGFALVTATQDFGPAKKFDPGLSDFVRKFGVVSNSKWALDYTFRIVPILAYDGIVNEVTYPQAVVFAPFEGAYVILGRANLIDNVVFINWRYTEDPTLADESDALATLTHELIHVQGGIFGEGTSEELESATQAATIEVLASMCNFGDDVACRAFLREIQNGVRAILIRDLSMYNAEWIWQTYANLFLRNESEQRIAEKSLRHWASNQQERMDIIKKYGTTPIEQYVGPGLRGKTFRTDYFFGPYIPGAPASDFGRLGFDDARLALFRLRGLWPVLLLSTYGEQ